ncbi:MAG: amino acid adenylation domain-containing protein, partial [Acidobacteriaceae bacterium]|nr:amino acid adenylation domain-containing protein [Acidobacteriaceae bacterium]
NPSSPATASNAAYVIYTSGSTGKPKGVVLEHRSTVALIYWARTIFGPEDLACVLASATINFDCSVFELYVPLCWGGKIILAKNALELPSLPEAQEITLLNTVPSSMAELLRVNGIPKSVRTVNLSGDVLPPPLVTQLYQRPHIERVHNGYGPTEDTTFTTFALLPRDNEGPPPIGRPVDNEQVYIVDRHFNPVPIGVPGELCIAGDGLARGYLNRPEATAEKFVPNPFDAAPEARLYRTGDLARYRADGNIDFLGRIDHQVKIRGFRVELGEVETTLAQHPAIREVVVMAREDTPGVKRLVAYVVPAGPATLNTSELRNFVSERLPDYMVPSFFLVLDAMPVTSGCKVDRRALPAPEPNRPELEQEFVAPRNEAEEVLARIWQEVLGLERVGVFDNFFDLGGDSILSLQVIARANQEGWGLTAKQLFQHQTVAGLAAIAETTPTIEAEQGLVLGPVPLTPIQHWFFEQDIPERHHWNFSAVLELQEPVEEAALRQTLEGLLRHHDALRLRFTPGARGWEQVLSSPPEHLPFSVFDVSTLSAEEQRATLETEAARLQTSLNLSEGPMVRMALFHFGPDQPQRLLLIVHHLAVDGLSWRILLEDISVAYQQVQRGQALQLPRKTSSFKTWAEQLTAYAQTATVREELPYWRSQTASGEPPVPLDFPEGENNAASARTISVSLETEETEALLRSVLASSRSQMNELLLTALTLTLFRWQGAHAAVIHLEGHGREDIFPEVEVSRTVGWFTTMFPVRLDLEAATTGATALRTIKRQVRQIPQKGIGYGVLRYLSGDAEVVHQLQTGTPPELSFNYLGQFDQVLRGASSYRQARESGGPSRTATGSRAHVFDVTTMIVEGRLKATWIYSENLHRRETMERLAQGFLEELRALMTECTTGSAGEPFVAPRTPVEETVAHVWADLLRAEPMSVQETFFDLGGDAATARQACRSVQELFEITLPDEACTGAQTVAEWAAAIDEMLLHEIEGLPEEEARSLL